MLTSAPAVSVVMTAHLLGLVFSQCSPYSVPIPTDGVFGKILAGHAQVKVGLGSPFVCGKACLARSWCRSFNYLPYRRLCQLNDVTASEYPDDLESGTSLGDLYCPIHNWPQSLLEDCTGHGCGSEEVCHVTPQGAACLPDALLAPATSTLLSLLTTGHLESTDLSLTTGAAPVTGSPTSSDDSGETDTSPATTESLESLDHSVTAAVPTTGMTTSPSLTSELTTSPSICNRTTSCVQCSPDRAIGVLRFRPIGCLQSAKPLRALQHSIGNYRDSVDWNVWPDLSLVINACAQEATNYTYSFFGIEFFGECYGGNLNNLDLSLGEVPMAECDTRCPAGTDVGGEDSMVVFEFF